MSESAWKQMHDKVTTLDMLGVSNVYDMQGLHNQKNNRNVMHRCHHEKIHQNLKINSEKESLSTKVLFFVKVSYVTEQISYCSFNI